jgi:hypothetical protein
MPVWRAALRPQIRAGAYEHLLVSHVPESIGYFQAFTGVPRADFVWTRGQPGTFHSSKAVARDFCRECGTPLTYRRVAVDRISVTVGSLDQPYTFPSEVQCGIENHHTLLTGSRKARVSRVLSRQRGHLEIMPHANIPITTLTSGSQPASVTHLAILPAIAGAPSAAVCIGDNGICDKPG